MTKKEAAAFLDISVRTLERYVAKGLIKQGRDRAKTRPLTTYAPEDVEALKAIIEKPISRADGTAKLPPSDTVGFRLDPLYVRRLTSEGSEHGLSAGEYARTLVIRSLEDTREAEFKDEVRSLREGLAQAFYALLVMKFEV